MGMIPISIDWATRATWQGSARVNRLSADAMATLIRCCIQGLDRMGDISPFVQAVKVSPFVTHARSNPEDRFEFRNAFYNCKITLAIDDGKDEIDIFLEIHLHSNYLSAVDEALEEHFISSFSQQLTEKIQAYRDLLRKRADKWSEISGNEQAIEAV